MYIGHDRLCVCLSSHSHTAGCTDTDVTWRNGTGCPLVVHCWADLQSVHGFVAMTTYTYVGLQPYTLQIRIASNSKCQRVLVPLYMYAWFDIIVSVHVAKAGDAVTLLGTTCSDGGWHFYSGTGYYFCSSATKENWEDSRADCQSINGDLASISDQAEMDFVISIS